MSHFFHRPHRKSSSGKNHTGSFIDGLIYPIALIAPVMTFPQLSEIWIHKHVAGVSIVTWASYAVGSGLWMIYGLFHKERPIIFVNLMLLIVQSSIVLGVLLYR